MKKKSIANLVMVALIVVIAAAGILGVGHIQGWFDAADGTQAVLQDMRGVIDLQRDGVSYPVSQETVLRAGDQITCQHGATAAICMGNDRIILGEKASVTVEDPAADGFRARIHTGEVFAHCDTAASLSFEDKTFVIRQATALLSVRSGAQALSVLRGTVDDASAGRILQFIGGEKIAGDLALGSLNDFTIRQIRSLNDASLCFTAEDLDRLAAERRQALEELINSQTKPSAPADTPTTPTEATEPAQETEVTKPTEKPHNTPCNHRTPGNHRAAGDHLAPGVCNTSCRRQLHHRNFLQHNLGQYGRSGAGQSGVCSR